MKHILVVYASHYGATRRYAACIAKALHARLAEARDAAPLLAGADIVVWGGGLYAGGVNGAKLLAKNAEKLLGKRLIFFTCGLADPEEPADLPALQQTAQRALPAALRENAAVFHLRGAMDYAALSPLHRLMMGMMKRMIERKGGAQTGEDRQFLDTYGKKVDFVDLSAAGPLAALLRAAAGDAAGESR